MTSTPKHVAIIMDGNGRWARQQGKPVLAGHQAGAGSVEQVMRGAIKNGVAYVTLYGFSTENWQRPPEEVNGLMDLLRLYIQEKEPLLHEEKIRFKHIGDLAGLPADIQALIAKLEAATQGYTRLTMVLALNYGARAELLYAIQQLGDAPVTEAALSKALYTSDIPDPDLLIRTSGEQRLSNFLLWQLAYAELYFTPILWPDFDEAAFDAALAWYAQRERRYGGR